MNTIELSVGKQGRIVIPSNLRQQLAIKPGAQLVAWVEDGRLVMEVKQQLWQSLHQEASKNPNLSQALINERRISAQQENL